LADGGAINLGLGCLSAGTAVFAALWIAFR
jgi:hypothetical protein